MQSSKTFWLTQGAMVLDEHGAFVCCTNDERIARRIADAHNHPAAPCPVCTGENPPRIDIRRRPWWSRRWRKK